MKKRILILLFSISIIGINCNSTTISKKEAQNKLEVALKMKISDDFKIANINNSYSTTSDYTESFSVEFQKDEFERIFNQVKPKQFKKDSTLYYVEADNGNNHVSITFEPKINIIYCNYIYE